MKQKHPPRSLSWLTNEVVAILIAIAIVSFALGLQVHHYGVNLANTPIGKAFGAQTSSTAACNAEATASVPRPCGIEGTWGLKFDDEFNGTSLNRSYWAESWPSGYMNNVKTDPSNVSVSGGSLNLTLSSESDGALVTTDPNLANPGFQFGTGYIVEARIYFPGNGISIDNWPAFWILGSNSDAVGSETDIAEGTGWLASYYHGNYAINDHGQIDGVWAGGWHTYALDREPGVSYLYWDGKLVRKYITDDNGSPRFIILNVGLNPAQTVTGTDSQVKVDYARVWQRVH
jgi:hypothetical protein